MMRTGPAHRIGPSSTRRVYYPAEILDSYFQGQYCEPFTSEAKLCKLGNYAVYSINVTGVSEIPLRLSGTCGTVGAAGGYTAGGGYGSLTSLYGMTADSVLEWEVVTAAGENLTVTPQKYADLYWALNGGGASTFAVVVSMTTRTYDVAPCWVLASQSLTVTRSPSETTIDLFHSSLAPVVDTGVTLTYFILGTELIVFAAVIPGSDPTLLTTALAPIVRSLDQAGVAVNISSSSFSSYHALYES
ncbi:FAD linked oxidase N-terminal [Penicillium taxi]|uniref:FAD linked oxidase N-terminal n=1 Tax=Penicillium taxi TaxID=168475 RepID=UPI00254509D6|nr:FAD linked oxidase N-terminal [Penicillium taxi]KAJ5895451.1 FAD linked oxidase N-terminal [Penicillium taxi]